jgi:hypothetical protein
MARVWPPPPIPLSKAAVPAHCQQPLTERTHRPRVERKIPAGWRVRLAELIARSKQRSTAARRCLDLDLVRCSPAHSAKQYRRPAPPRGAVSLQPPFSCDEFHDEYGGSGF